MLRLTLPRKLFLALATVLVVLLLAFAGLTRLGLQRSLGSFVADIEITRMDWLLQGLARDYAAHGSWAFLQGGSPAQNSAVWHQLQMRANQQAQGQAPHNELPMPPGERPPGPPPGALGPPPGHGAAPPLMRPQVDVLPRRFAPPPPPDARGDPRRTADSVYQRLALLDRSGLQVAGTLLSPEALGAARRRAVWVGDEAVGYLALVPLAGVQGGVDDADELLLAQQSRLMAWLGLGGLAVVLGLSWGVARRWFRPIHELVDGANAVARGELDTRVAVRSPDELGQLASTFNTMAARLGAIEVARQQWLADVAHELRTPLAALQAEIEALQDGVRPFTPPTADRLHRQVLRLTQLLADLRLTLDDAGELPLRLAPLSAPDVCAVLHDALQTLQLRFEQAGLQVDSRALAALPDTNTATATVLADAQRLHQVFANLLENTLRYTDAGGRLVLAAQLTLTATGGELRITFDDTAPAPTAADLPQLFDRFYRAERSRDRAQGGAGLGLAICQRIVRAHGGRLAAQLSPLGGLAVELVLPVTVVAP